MLKQKGAVDSSNIIGEKADTYRISLINILTQPSASQSSTSDSLTVKVNSAGFAFLVMCLFAAAFLLIF